MNKELLEFSVKVGKQLERTCKKLKLDDYQQDILDEDLMAVFETECKKIENDVESYKNRIRVLQNLNTKYREKLGISNEPINALGLISPLDGVSQAE